MSSYTNGEVLSISFELWINDTKIEGEKKSCINSIDIKETVEGADTLTIKVSDPNFEFINENIFVKETPVKAQIGWCNTTYRVEFSGYISTVDVDFQSNGIPLLNITCMDNTHVMNREKKDNTFSNTTSASVVKSIVESYGYKCVIEQGYNFKTQETITQSKQTDIDFIQKLAKDEVYPFTARLVGDTFYYVKKGHLTTPKMELSYYVYPFEIISFNPKLNKETRKSSVKSAKVDTSTKEVSDVTSVQENSGSKSSSKKSKGMKYDEKTNTWSPTNTTAIKPRKKVIKNAEVK